MTIQITALSFVLKNVLVDPLMADGNPVLFLEPEADLLRAPVLAQQMFNSTPTRAANTWSRLILPPLDTQPMRLLWSVATQSPIALQLTADRGLVAAQHSGHLGLVMTCFHECVNLVSFFLGKLRVAAHRAPLSCRLEKAVMLPQLALSPLD